MKQPLRHRFLWKTFLYSIIPWAIILSAFVGIYRYTLGEYERELTGRYTRVSQSLAAELNLIFSGAAHTGYVLAGSPSFSEIEQKNPGEDIFDSSIRELIDLKALFSDTAIFSDIIDSIFFYIPNADTVLHSMGTESADLFFSTTNRLRDYPPDFWTEFSPSSNAYQILDATVKKPGTPQERRVIPLIIPRRNSRFYITLLIRESFILRVLENHHITPNTSFTILAEDGTVQISSGPSPTPGPSLHSSPEGGEEAGWQVLKSTFFLGEKLFTLVTAFPHKDILALTRDLRLVIIAASLLLVLLSSVISFLLARNISRPVEGLIELMKRRASRAAGTREAAGIEALQEGVRNLLTRSDMLNRSLSDTTPAAIEHYMEHLLLDRGTANPWLVMKKLRSFGFEFPYADFQVALVQLSPSEDMFQQMSSQDISLLYQGAFDVISGGMPEPAHIWQVGFDEHTIRFLINLPPDFEAERITDSLESFVALFGHDAHLQNIAVGVGRICRGAEAVHRSYTEARAALLRVAAESPNSVRLYRESVEKPPYLLPDQDANRLYELLTQGRAKETEDHLADIFEANRLTDIGKEGWKRLCFRLYVIVRQVLLARQLSEPALMGTAYLPVAFQFDNLGPEELQGYLIGLTNALLLAVQPSVTHKIEKHDIENYIEEHFSSDISLNDLAERCGTTPVYVSKCFTRLFGVSFTSYLAEKRISFAAYLLAETPSLTIEEISSICGYSSRIHFTRTFKQRRGVPPVEFRKRAQASGARSGPADSEAGRVAASPA